MDGRLRRLATSATWTAPRSWPPSASGCRTPCARIGGRRSVTVEGIHAGAAPALPQQEPVPRGGGWQRGVLQGAESSGHPRGAVPHPEAPGRRGGPGPADVPPALRRQLLRRENAAGAGAVPVRPHQRRGAVAAVRAGEREEAAPRTGAGGDLLRQALPDDRGRGAGREHPAHRRGAGTVNTAPCGARTCWTDTLCGLTSRLSVPSFYQVNRDMAEVLYRYALWTSRDSPGTDTVLDLYCGAGTITQVMARRAAPGHRRGDRAGGHRRRQGQRAAQRRRRMWSSSAATRRHAAADLPPGAACAPDVICVDPPRKGLGTGGGTPPRHQMAPQAHRLRLLRFGQPGQGCEVPGGKRLPGNACASSGYVSDGGTCGDGMFIVQT